MLLYHGADKNMVGKHGTPKEVALHEKQLGIKKKNLALYLLCVKDLVNTGIYQMLGGDKEGKGLPSLDAYNIENVEKCQAIARKYLACKHGVVGVGRFLSSPYFLHGFNTNYLLPYN